MVEVELGSLGNSTNELAVVNLQRNGVTVPGASSTAAGGVASANSAWCIGGGESNRTMTGRSLKFLDSPASISAQTYKCQMLSNAGSTSYLNRWGIGSNGDCISSITLTEIPQ